MLIDKGIRSGSLRPAAMQFIYDQGVMVWPLPSQMRMVGVQVRMAVCEEFGGHGRPKAQDSGQPCGADHGQS
ncbi:hypothetical protein [Cypionkella psychrotolerans]|uniref:hypothetical protein n=1 Tax=Cypionkella psychrotolerans TaxID=1678131 RepID=UPI0006B5ACFA|nr:hypothetical protein [Cypionkella psychrotolerans]